MRFRRPSRLFQRPGLAAWILVGGVLASVGTFALVRTAQVARARARFQAAVADSDRRLELRLRVCEDLLRGVRGLVDAQGGLDRERFRVFLDAKEIDRRYPGLLGVSYSVAVRPGGLPAIEERLRTDHGGRVRIHPGTGYPDDAIVLFAEPEALNAGALGFNSASSPSQVGSLVGARDSGEVRVSPPMTVIQAPEAGPGIVMRLAAYVGGAVPASVEARREAFHGTANAVFLLADLTRDASDRLARDGIRVDIEDRSDPSEPLPVVTAGAEIPRRWYGVLGPGRLEDRGRLEVGGRPWVLHFSAGGGFFTAAEATLPWLMALGTLLIGTLLAALVRSIARTGQRAQDLAEGMTERLRRSESRLRAVTQVMPDLILVLDSDGRYLEAHTADPTSLVAPLDRMIGRRVTDLLPAELGRTVLATVRRALDEGRVQTLEYDIDIQRGPVRFEARVAPMGIEIDGKPCVIWVARDITERLAQEEAHQQAQKLESLGLLAGGIAHDFNNLLAAIGGYVSLGRMAFAEGRDPTPDLDRMEASIRRAADLSQQLLAYSGRAAFQVGRLDLNALVREMAGLLSVSHAKSVALDLQLAEGVLPILGDRAQVQQVVMNLVTNASESTGPEGGRVDLSTGACDLSPDEIERRMPGQGLAPGRYVTLEVRDNGSVMSEEVLARIFDPFFTTKPRGRGLGLSALRGILRGHRAGIEIATAPGHGSTFRVFFPAPPGPAPADEEPVREDERSRPLSGGLLVADDEPPLREVTRRMAELLGMDVLEAADGEEAWTVFQERRDGLRAMVLDLTMPRLGGAEVHRRIRDTMPRFPIVLCTGYSREALPVLRDGEPTVFLQKPFTFKDLENALREVIARAEVR